MMNERILESIEQHDSRPALWIDNRHYSYRNLAAIASRLHHALCDLPSWCPVGVLTTRSLAAYAGILGTVFGGHPYIPLNIDYPFERLVRIVGSAGSNAIILPSTSLDLGLALQAAADTRPALIILDEADYRIDVRTAARWLGSDQQASPVAHDDEQPAYIMFTSGTTGEPKGIAISQANLAAYLDAINHLFDFRADDRFSQFFNLSFDLSVHDLFVTWTQGACLYVPSQAELMDPVGFAQRHQLTVWFSVPSAASLAMRFRKLRPDCLPTLRHALFCGEALSGEVARAFAAAAPSAQLTNLYGPTEATIAVTHYRLPGHCMRTEQNDRLQATVVPIGHAFPSQETLVLGEDMAACVPGEVGELWLGGSQIAKGYTNNPEQTASKFRRFTHPDRTSDAWYATGDLVEEHNDLGLLYRGRKDDQIKLHGHRIELTEVEEALRKAAATPLAFVTPWPMNAVDGPSKLIALVAAPHRQASEILAAMAEELPPFMVPASIQSTTEMSLNINGKLDRKKTIERWNFQTLEEYQDDAFNPGKGR